MERHGEPIAGSKLFRAFCTCCKEPIRVGHDDLSKKNVCRECSRPLRIGCGSPHGSGHDGIDEDAGGYLANAIMALEGD